MKRLPMLAVLMLAHTAFAAPSGAEGAPAEPTSKEAEARIQHALVEPLAAKDRDQSKFSRARLPPQERRVRILDERPVLDARGGAFYTFAVDARMGIHALGNDDGWRLATVTGCVYVTAGDVFVKVGERHRPAAFLLGKNLKPVAEATCMPAPATASAD